MSYYAAYVATNENQTLAYPHYSDERWRTPQLIYGRECKCANVNYSDRLWEWDYEAGVSASTACKNLGLQSRTAGWTQAWLSTYHGRPVVLRYILGGSNLATGYEYYVYGYDFERGGINAGRW